MNKQHLKEYQKQYQGTELLLFLLGCLDNIPLDCVDTNDWQCNLKPAVYIHNKHNRFIAKKYYSRRKGNLQKAVSFYNTETPKKPYTHCE